MSVYRDIVVEIPKERVTIEKQRDGKPALVKYVLEAPYDREKGYSKPRRTTIGHQCPDNPAAMHPTTQYANMFPSLWEKVSAEKITPSVLKTGMFAACQAINRKNGIKDILDNVYGLKYADALMDYAMYSVIRHNDTDSDFSETMSDELLFSGEPLSDSYYMRLFSSGIPKEKELLFKHRWVLKCREEGIDTVWLCIDEVSEDTQEKYVEIPDETHSQAEKGSNVLSFIYGIAPDGRPVTYDSYRGKLVDADALDSVSDLLRECGIRVAGVMLDRGCCDSESLQYLNEHGIRYIIAVRNAADRFREIYEECAGKIKLNANYLVLYTNLSACQKQVQLFSGCKHKDYLTLFYDYDDAFQKTTELLNGLYAEMSRLEECAGKGEIPVIDSKYSELLTIRENKQPQIIINNDRLQTLADQAGIYAIVTSEETDPSGICKLYTARNASGMQYSFSQAKRTRYSAKVRTGFAIAFIASVLRYEISIASCNPDTAADPLIRNRETHTEQIIEELEKISAKKINGVYTNPYIINDRTDEFFRHLHTDASEFLDKTVRSVNNRLAGRVPAPRKRKTGPKKGSHRKVYDEQGNVIPRKPGVKKGTKRKDINKDGTLRRKPGVKPGTKREVYNKDGSIRKKPGPKTKADSINEQDKQQ